MTFDEFITTYPKPTGTPEEILLRAAAERWDIYRLGFVLRMRVPNVEGFFGDVEGAEWCRPSEWLSKYYAKRVGNLGERPWRLMPKEKENDRN